MQADRKYWLNQFSGELPLLELPGDNARPVSKTFNGKTANYEFNTLTSISIREYAQKKGGTVFMGLLSGVFLLLKKYAGQDDLIIGTPVAGREHSELEDIIGFFVNTIAIRSSVSATENFDALFSNVMENTLNGYTNQLYPFDELVDALKLKRDNSRNALFEVMAVMQNAGTYEYKNHAQDRLKISGYGGEISRFSKFDLVFNFSEAGDAIKISLEYNCDIFRQATVEKMLRHLEALLDTALRHPSLPLCRLDYLSEQEKLCQLIQFQGHNSPYRSDKTVISLFEEQVAKTPMNKALIFKERTFSYQELNLEADKLAAFLVMQHVKKGDNVAVLLNRSEWMIISLLAIMKTGAVYVPLDPEFPEDRIETILNDSKAVVTIDSLLLSGFLDVRDSISSDIPVIERTACDLLYIMFTSGSTGKPKGVMVENRGVINMIDWMWQQFNFTQSDLILQKTSFTFDVSVWEIFMPLCNGAAVLLCEDQYVASPADILRYIRSGGATALSFVPGLLNTFIYYIKENNIPGDPLSTLKMAASLGEALPPETVRGWYSITRAPLHNMYGPTEASIAVTLYTTKPDDVLIPIGKPIANTQMYVLGDALELLPVGVPGDIYIGGDCLSRGYLNQPDLTAASFIANPFQQGARIYRTGDRGRWLGDGNIDYLSRKDDQVKIRGYRIELGEIENALLSNPFISAAAVITKDDPVKGKLLIAYLVSAHTLDKEEIRGQLSGKLPSYMVPAEFILLDNMPLTSSGKIDKKKLVAASGFTLESMRTYIAPVTETERLVCDLWSGYLGSVQVGLGDNFFDLGGHSLLAAR
ncbi:MAG: amino acid adenylation domain-containing protein, partial [Bacteroidetes bacterium]|nr:amino acid adenylation domain-containing protein [Bacteroidota bacterium]